MLEANQIDVLENRIQKLEQKIFGSASHYGEYPEICSTLTEVSSKLGNALSTRDRMTTVMKRLDELNKYLDPCYGTSTSELSDSAMTDMMLVQQELWENQLKQLEQADKLKTVLDSKPIADSISLNDKLVEVTVKQTDLQELSEDQRVRVGSLVQSYNAILQTITETLARMDEVVTRAEMAAQPKKNQY